LLTMHRRCLRHGPGRQDGSRCGMDSRPPRRTESLVDEALAITPGRRKAIDVVQRIRLAAAPSTERRRLTRADERARESGALQQAREALADRILLCTASSCECGADGSSGPGPRPVYSAHNIAAPGSKFLQHPQSEVAMRCGTGDGHYPDRDRAKDEHKDRREL
jgi:hypothetical protein